MKSLLIAMVLTSAIAIAAPSRKIILGGVPIQASAYEIQLPDSPTPSEAFAAEEFNTHWKRMTGETLPVVSESQAHPGLNFIYIGRPRTQILLGDEGIQILSDGPNLMLMGGQRGVLYAVYSFLEEYLGCRWFTADCIVTPDSGTATLPELHETYLPPLEYRDTDYPTRRPPEFGVRNKLNGSCGTEDPKWGGHIFYVGFVHTFDALVPPEKYAKDHPEYYSEINGKRVTENSQLCLTNPEVLRIATEEVRKRMRENPAAQIFSVSQNDRFNYCTCAKCAALAEKEGSQSGPLIHFVNAIADAVREEFPDKIVDTLAYQWSRKPPKSVRPSPNVAVRLCTIECCFTHPLESCPQNASFVADIEGWSKLTRRLHIWDYVIDYAHCVMPFPDLNVLQPNIAFFIRHGVTGIYEEANYFTAGGELAELREYLIAKCLWNPQYDVQKGIAEFCDAYYGAASPAIRKYIARMHQTICGNPNLHVGIFAPPQHYLDNPQLLDDSAKYLEEALTAVAGNPALERRVKTVRLGITYTNLKLHQASYRQQEDQLCKTVSVTAAQIRDFIDDAHAAGITAFHEGGQGDCEPWLRELAQIPDDEKFPLVLLKSPTLKLTVLPAIGGRILAAIALPSGQPILKVAGELSKACNPLEFGYEEYAGPQHHDRAWNAPFRVDSQTDAKTELSAALDDGSVFRRTIEALPDRTAFRVSSTLAGAKGDAVLRAHPVFQVSSTAQIEVWAKYPSGWKRLEIPDPHGVNTPSEQWLSDSARPDGQWAILDKGAKTVLVDTFDPHTVQACYLFWTGEHQVVNLETRTFPSATPLLQNTYELLPEDQAPWMTFASGE